MARHQKLSACYFDGSTRLKQKVKMGAVQNLGSLFFSTQPFLVSRASSQAIHPDSNSHKASQYWLPDSA
jgi:hypothetical protein